MWMRTTMNYQYRFGTSTTEAMKHLWREGKIRRFYRGYGPALLQGPISRFGDTAANVGILALLESNTELPIALKTGAASITAGVWRIFIMPIDTVKTTLQVIDTFQALSKLLYIYIYIYIYTLSKEELLYLFTLSKEFYSRTTIPSTWGKLDFFTLWKVHTGYKSLTAVINVFIHFRVNSL